MSNTTFNKLSNDLSAAIDTGNAEEVAVTIKATYEALDAGEISIQQQAELILDAEVAGYDV